jgi:hypothetical protein
LVASFNASFASNIARSAWQTLKYVQFAVCPSFMQRNYTDTCMPLQRKKTWSLIFLLRLLLCFLFRTWKPFYHEDRQENSEQSTIMLK